VLLSFGVIGSEVDLCHVQITLHDLKPGASPLSHLSSNRSLHLSLSFHQALNTSQSYHRPRDRHRQNN